MSDTQETIVMLKTFTLGKLLAVLENPFADSPMLQKWYTEEDLAEPAFRFCICFLACAEWSPDPYSQNLPDTDTACDAVCSAALEFLDYYRMFDPVYTKGEIGSIYRQALDLLLHGSDTTKIMLGLGALISGEPMALLKNTYWSSRLMHELETIKIPSSVNAMKA